jgi:hypothetical protein
MKFCRNIEGHMGQECLGMGFFVHKGIRLVVKRVECVSNMTSYTVNSKVKMQICKKAISHKGKNTFVVCCSMVISY